MIITKELNSYMKERNNMLQLIIGGSGSGKSEYAEDMAVSLGERPIYIATMYPFDNECRVKIARHRQMRKDKNFETIECYCGLENLEIDSGSGPDPDATILLECMSNLVANEMYQEEGAKENTVETVLRGIRHLQHQVKNLIIVTNEVFSDGEQIEIETKRYLSYLGEINAHIARMADKVIEVVYTIPVEVKE